MTRDPDALIDLTRPQAAIRYEFRDRLSGPEVDEWWCAYDLAFGESNRSSPQRQTMSREEFAEAMVDREVTKVVAVDDSGILALTVYGDVRRIGVFAWLSQEYFEHHYPDRYAAGAVQYFVATLTRPDRRAAGLMASMGQMITNHLMDRWGDVVVVFDCSESNAGLAEALHGLVAMTLEEAGAELGPLEHLGRQEFHAFGLARPPSAVAAARTVDGGRREE